MRKRQEFMVEGAKVIALGNRGVITKIIGAAKPYQEYVTDIHVKLDCNVKAGKYNALDIEPYDPNDPAQVYLEAQIAKKNYHQNKI